MKSVDIPAACGFTDKADDVLSRGITKYVEEVLYETPTMYYERARTIDIVEYIISKWVYDIYQIKYGKKNMSASVGRLAKIYPYGSYLLDVHIPGSDIDSVVLLPCYVAQDNFLSYLPLILLQDTRCTKATAITAAKHKLITICFNNMDLDLRPLILGEDVIPKSLDYLNELDFKNITQLMRESVAAVAVNMWIKRETDSLQHEFKCIVRFLKQVIEKCGISGNKFGYFGGINLTLLVCFLMRQMGMQRLSVWTYLYNFFYIYSRYDYSSPIVLNSDIVYQNQYTAMQIITPVKPEQNSAAKVTESGRRVIKQVFRVCEQNMNMLMYMYSQCAGKDYIALFNKKNLYYLIFMNLDQIATPMRQCFFQDSAFKAGYLYIYLNGDNEEALKLAKSKLEPMLVFMFNALQNIAKYEAPGFANIDYVRPWPEWFTKSQFHGSGYFSETIFIAISKSSGEKNWLIYQLKDMINGFKAYMQLRFQQDEVPVYAVISQMVIAIKGGKELRQLLAFE